MEKYMILATIRMTVPPQKRGEAFKIFRSVAEQCRDEKAEKLIDEFLAIEKAEAELKAACVLRLSKVLPQKKVMRYLQVENKIRAIVKYDLASQVPLAQ
jgi:hypothetical protein